MSAKSSVLWPSEYAKMRLRPWLAAMEPTVELTTPLPDPSALGRGQTSPYPTPLGASIFPLSAFSTRIRLDLGETPQIFFLEPLLVVMQVKSEVFKLFAAKVKLVCSKKEHQDDGCRKVGDNIIECFCNKDCCNSELTVFSDAVLFPPVKENLPKYNNKGEPQIFGSWATLLCYFGITLWLVLTDFSFVANLVSPAVAAAEIYRNIAYSNHTVVRLRLPVCPSNGDKTAKRWSKRYCGMWVWDGVVVGVGLRSEGREEKTQKHAFRRAGLYTFIISKTFTRGRYSLTVGCFSGARVLNRKQSH